MRIHWAGKIEYTLVHDCSETSSRLFRLMQNVLGMIHDIHDLLQLTKHMSLLCYNFSKFIINIIQDISFFFIENMILNAFISKCYTLSFVSCTYFIEIFPFWYSSVTLWINRKLLNIMFIVIQTTTIWSSYFLLPYSIVHTISVVVFQHLPNSKSSLSVVDILSSANLRGATPSVIPLANSRWFFLRHEFYSGKGQRHMTGLRNL